MQPAMFAAALFAVSGALPAAAQIAPPELNDCISKAWRAAHGGQ